MFLFFYLTVTFEFDLDLKFLILLIITCKVSLSTQNRTWIERKPSFSYWQGWGRLIFRHWDKIFGFLTKICVLDKSLGLGQNFGVLGQILGFWTKLKSNNSNLVGDTEWKLKIWLRYKQCKSSSGTRMWFQYSYS